MNTIIALILAAALGSVVTFIVCKIWYTNHYGATIQGLLKQLNNWEEHSKQLEKEFGNYIGKRMPYIPEVIGEAITEPEDWRENNPKMLEHFRKYMSHEPDINPQESHQGC